MRYSEFTSECTPDCGNACSSCMVSITSGSRNLPAACGSRWNKLIIAAAILKSLGGARACCGGWPAACFCASGSSQRRRCSRSFSPSVGLNQLESSSSRRSKPTNKGIVRFL